MVSVISVNTNIVNKLQQISV